MVKNRKERKCASISHRNYPEEVAMVQSVAMAERRSMASSTAILIREGFLRRQEFSAGHSTPPGQPSQAV
jgi:hypothetical protein